jgi:tetratricopeptide (TPR) repeat protein
MLKKLIVIVSLVFVSAAGIFVFWFWRENQEINLIKSLAVRHPDGQNFVEEILQAKKDLIDFDLKNDLAALIKRGVNYNLLGEKQKALDDYQRALKISPDNLLVLNNLAEIYNDWAEFQKSEEYFLKLLEFYPQNTLAWRKLGYLYWYRLNKTPTEIENFFKSGLAKTNNSPDLLSWLASYFQEIGDNQKFVEYANRLIKP